MGNLLRNREARRYFLAIALVGLAGVCCILYLDLAAGIVAALLTAAILLISAAFTRARYRRLARLAEQLEAVAAGNYQLDIREYEEGELSILSSEILKITSALAHQADQMAQDKLFLSDALSDISHQLKTPLTGISMMTDLLYDPDLPPQKRAEFLNGIHSGTQRLQWLVSALLKLSRLDAGAVEFRKERVALSDVLEEAVSPLRIPMEIKDQRFAVDGAQGLTVLADLRWLAEALGNLLKNCVEHTPIGGSIRISCGQTPLYVLLEVEDDGPGISQEDLPHIFDRFYRGKNAGADSVGIGLALCKSILQNQGASVEAYNKLTGGTRFTVKLYPAAAEAPEEKTPTSTVAQ